MQANKVLRLLCAGLLILIAMSIGNRGWCVDELPASDSSDTKEYVISPNDFLEITVYGEPDLSITVKVPQDGKITYPLLGSIKTTGLTVRDLEKTISDLLEQDYLVSPQVSIFVKEYGTVAVSVLGQVKTPGSYEIRDNFSLTQVIARAGGFTENADTSKVKIMRGKGYDKEVIEVDADQIMRRSATDIVIKADDTIIVEECGKISIMGQVIRPGSYVLKRGLTAVGAISMAGGFTPTAAQNGTRVVRVENGVKRIIPVPAASIVKSGDTSRDVVLQADDTVIVPESFF